MTQPSTPEELLALVIQGAQRVTPEAKPSVDAGALTAAGRGPRDPVWEWVDSLRPLMPEVPEPELARLFEFALLGVSVGFGDRNLSPHLEEHRRIVPLLLDDIAQVYRQLQLRQAHYSPEELIFRAYDYGIHKAYYLDWQLYLSRDLY